LIFLLPPAGTEGFGVFKDPSAPKDNYYSCSFPLLFLRIRWIRRSTCIFIVKLIIKGEGGSGYLKKIIKKSTVQKKKEESKKL
jgi:hypothetical protein